mmetsp:Transcript_64986/g.105310  ORF Transcript_64986/g.105310 Transcript_64986/m.105310 type:complete len:108 (+) Transcript_64986:422-745(+)
MSERKGERENACAGMGESKSELARQEERERKRNRRESLKEKKQRWQEGQGEGKKDEQKEKERDERGSKMQRGCACTRDRCTKKVNQKEETFANQVMQDENHSLFQES